MMRRDSEQWKGETMNRGKEEREQKTKCGRRMTKVEALHTKVDGGDDGGGSAETLCVWHLSDRE